MDYHDLKILELETIAVEQRNQARLAVEGGDLAAAEKVLRWETTIENIRQLMSLGSKL